jgi:SpoIID/LytB domain protein
MPPSPSPSVSPSPSPSPTPTPTPLFNFYGRGTHHGVGLSQYGARGRANDGQTFDQILMHYYTNTQIGTIDGQALIRVQLAASYKPTASKPARVTTIAGGWTNALFPGQTFGPGTYVEMWQPALAPAAPPTPEPSPDPSSSPSASPSAPPSPSPTPTPIPAGHWVAVVFTSTGTEIARATGPELYMEATDASTVLNTSFKDSHPAYTQFRGSMRLTVTSSGGLQQVNVLPLDVYLRGVIPSEMPASWHIEAVKAQSIAARSYAWPRIGRAGSYDILPTSANQVYRGLMAEHPRSNLAVDDTAGMVLLHNGKVITAYFHAASGGHTENSEYAFPGTAGKPGSVVAYVRGKPDVDANGLAYDRSYGKFEFTSASFTMAQLSTIMSKNSATDVGNITSLSFERGVSGRVYRVTMIGSKGTKVVSGGIFRNTYNSHRLSGDSVNSTMYWLQPITP